MRQNASVFLSDEPIEQNGASRQHMRHTSDGIAIDHVAIGILRRDGCILLVQQRVPGDSRLYWVLPGGLVEPGELVADALVREVREEAGVQVSTIAELACISQIDRPAELAQTLVFVFEVEQWHGEPASDDPDGEVLHAELVPAAEAIARLAANGGWPGFQGPILAYLKGEARAGTLWLYREVEHRQHLVGALGS
jgi:8-oxo-dGTP diphosphatase